MTLHPKAAKDLMLAPVAAEIDLNLQRLRDKSAQGVEAELEFELDRPAMSVDRQERERLVLRQALRDVDLHGWNAAVAGDGSSIRLHGGSVSLDLAVGAGASTYINDGIGV